METKWSSVKRYEFEAFVFGVALLIGSWVLSSQLSAPALLVLLLLIIGVVFTTLSALIIALKLLANFY